MWLGNGEQADALPTDEDGKAVQAELKLKSIWLESAYAFVQVWGQENLADKLNAIALQQAHERAALAGVQLHSGTVLATVVQRSLQSCLEESDWQHCTYTIMGDAEKAGESPTLAIYDDGFHDLPSQEEKMIAQTELVLQSLLHVAKLFDDEVALFPAVLDKLNSIFGGFRNGAANEALLEEECSIGLLDLLVLSEAGTAGVRKVEQLTQSLKNTENKNTSCTSV